MVLPQNTMTEWYWSGSLDAFADMCILRCKDDTQEETRQVADQISKMMEGLFPVSWDALLMEEEDNVGSHRVLLVEDSIFGTDQREQEGYDVNVDAVGVAARTSNIIALVCAQWFAICWNVRRIGHCQNRSSKLCSTIGIA